MSGGSPRRATWGLNKCVVTEEGSCGAMNPRIDVGVSSLSRVVENGGAGAGLVAAPLADGGNFVDFDGQFESPEAQTSEGVWNCEGPSVDLSLNSAILCSSNSNSANLSFGITDEGRIEGCVNGGASFGRVCREEALENRYRNRGSSSGVVNSPQFEFGSSAGSSIGLSVNLANSSSAHLNSANFGMSDEGRAKDSVHELVSFQRILREEVLEERCRKEDSASGVNSPQCEVGSSRGPSIGLSVDSANLNSANLGMSDVGRAEGCVDERPRVQRNLTEKVPEEPFSNEGSSSGICKLEVGSSHQRFDPLGLSDRLLQGISSLEDFHTPPEFQFYPISAWVGGSDDDEMLIDVVAARCQFQEVGSALEQHFRRDERENSIFDANFLSEEEIQSSSMFALPHMNVPDIMQHKRAKVLGSSSSGYFAATVPSSTAGASSSCTLELASAQNVLSGGGSQFSPLNASIGNDEDVEPMDSGSRDNDNNGGESGLDNREDNEVRMDLTDDLLHMVFSFLDHPSLCRAAIVCKQWCAASTHEDFWRSLNFENCIISIEQVAQMCRRYPKAVELNLRGAPSVDELVREAMYPLRNLEALILGRGSISDVFFNGLVDCPVLDRLNISDATLGSSSQEIHVRHDSLRHLQITRCRVVRISIRCPHLETLSLRRSGMASAMLTCPQLRELDVGSCHKLSDAGVRIAATSCPLLTSLDMSNCSYVSDETLREIAAACPSLRVLDASYCPNISLEAVRLPMLTDMKLHSCEGINASSMASLSHCFMLEALQLDFCWLLTSVTLDLPHLQNISLVSCRKFVELNLRSPVLSSINVSNCPILNRIDIMSNALEKLVLQKQQSLATISLQCRRLREVDLTECESLTNSICKVFSEKGGCPMLNSLILDSCESLTAVQLNSTSLLTLSLVGCRAMTNLELACPNLHQLFLDGCDHLEEALLCPVGLRSLNLGICPRLSKLEIEAPQMTVLELKGCGILSQALINCPQLLSLDASFCSQLQDDCLFATTASCPMIESLILMSCPSIGIEGLFALKLLSNLTLLDLSYTFLTNLQPVFETCIRLKVLKLQACKYLMDTSLDALHRGEALPYLCELDLSYSSLCQSAIEKLLTWCPHLTHVSLNGCGNMYDLDWGLETGNLYKDTGKEYAFSVHTGHTQRNQLESNFYLINDETIKNRLLENLNCVGCPNVRKVTIPTSALCLHLSSLNLSLSANLKEVDLGCCNLISLNLSNCLSLEILKLECPRLTSLFLQGCGIEEEEVESAIKNCNSLETLDVRLCPKISLTGIARLRMISPGLKRLFSSVSL